MGLLSGISKALNSAVKTVSSAVSSALHGSKSAKKTSSSSRSSSKSSSRSSSRSVSKSKSSARSSKPGSISVGGFSFNLPTLPKLQLPKVKVQLPNVKSISSAVGSASKVITSALPKVPTVKTPKISLPKLSLPTVAAAASVPALAVPLAVGSSLSSSISLPKVQSIKAPVISLPDLSNVSGTMTVAANVVPSFAAPLAIGSAISQMSLPKVPTIKTPDISLPKISLPDLSGVSGTVSSGVDSVIGARDQAYEQGGADIGAGNVAKGGTEIAGAAAADILLPLDLANCTNKVLTGRMDEISGEDAVWAAVDAVSLLAIPFTGGASYALARAAKGGKVLSSSAKVGKSMSLVSGLKSALKGVKGAGSVSGVKSYSSYMTAARRTVPQSSRTYGSAMSAFKSASTRKVVKKTPLLNSRTYKTVGSGTSTKTATKGNRFAETDPAMHLGSESFKVADAAKSADNVADSTSALGHTGQAASKSSGLWWKVGAAGLGASVLGSFLMGDDSVTGETDPNGTLIDPNAYPGVYPDGTYPAQEDLSDEEYIAALEAYIAELENALASGQITPEEYAELVEEAESEMQDTAGEYFDSPFGEWIMPAEEMAQDVTRAADGVPVVGDLLEWFRKHGLALPVLLVVGGGGAYLVLTKTKVGKQVLRRIKPRRGKK